MSDELPQGWASARLEEIVTKKKGKKPAVLRDTPADGFVPYLDIHAIEKNVVRQFAEVKSSRLAAKDDLFVVWDGARSGWIGGGITGAIGSTIMALTPQHVEPVYLRHFIAGQFQTINKNTRGTGIPHVDPEVFWNIEVPLAPLAEQRRIVAKLETMLGKVDASQQRLAKIPVLLKRFRQSVLAAACSGRLTADWREERVTDDMRSAEDLPEGWRNAPLSEFLESSFYGPRFGKESYASEGVPTIRTTDMGFDGSIVLTDAPRIKLSREELEKYRLRHGDLVVTRTGATIGKCAVYDELRGPAIPGAYLIRFRFKQDLVAPKYILRFFMSPAGQNLLIGGSNAVAQPNVNATTISQFMIPVPPLPEQQEIVRRVEGLFALADQLELRLAKARGQVDQLTPSLLARAFRGHLVPQDPNDEPASELLVRIRGEKTNQTQRGASGIYQASQRRRRKNLAGADISTLV